MAIMVRVRIDSAVRFADLEHALTLFGWEAARAEHDLWACRVAWRSGCVCPC
jgi:hypothetical protein